MRGSYFDKYIALSLCAFLVAAKRSSSHREKSLSAVSKNGLPISIIAQPECWAHTHLALQRRILPVLLKLDFQQKQIFFAAPNLSTFLCFGVEGTNGEDIKAVSLAVVVVSSERAVNRSGIVCHHERFYPCHLVKIPKAFSLPLLAIILAARNLRKLREYESYGTSRLWQCRSRTFCLINHSVWCQVTSICRILHAGQENRLSAHWYI